MNKKLAIAVSLGLVSALSIAGTMAYFKIDDQYVNNMMRNGNINVVQNEYEREVGSENLKGFTQYKPLYPVVDNTTIDGNKTDTALKLNGESLGSYKLYKDEVKNVQDKFVVVQKDENDDTPVYYRTIIAVEAPKGVGEKIQLNRNEQDFTWSPNGIPTTIDGVDFVIYEAVYNKALEKTVSEPSLLQVYLDSSTTNEQAAKFGENFDILVATQATPVEQFTDPQTALNKVFNGEISGTNHPWSGKSDILSDNSNVSQASAMQNVLNKGKDVIMTSNIETKSTITQSGGGVIDGGNNTLKLVNSIGDSKVLSTSGGTIKNLNIEGGYRGIYSASLQSDIIIDGVTSDATYALNIDVSKNEGTSLEVKNSTLKGWVSYGEVFDSATFTNCNFGKSSNGVANFKPYMTTTLTNCNFETGFKLDAQEIARINGDKPMHKDEQEPDEKIILKNCTINGTLITSKEQLEELIWMDDQPEDINKIEIQNVR